MPTGYTAAIKDGISFEQFATSCARAFGALVMMRDEPGNAPIPDRFEPSDFYQKNMESKRAELDRLMAFTTTDIEREAEAEYQAELAEHERCLRDASNLREAYEAMLAKAKAWTPPTSEHVGLRDFMVEQITQSISLDCDTSYYKAPERIVPAQWIADKIADARESLARYENEHRKEVELTEVRNQWLRALRDSLSARGE